MGRVYLCLGHCAGRPYEFSEARVRVGSVEELCYFLRENAYLLDPQMLDRKLVEWIRDECGLPELAQKLLMALKEKEAVQAFLEILFSYTGYYSREAAKKAVRVLKISEGISTAEKQKQRADFFLESQKYVLALQEYEEMIGKMQGAHPVFLGKLYHNRGTAQARLFLFEKAAASFETAYRMTGAKESLIQYLTAMRFALPEMEYVPFLAEHPELYEISLELETRLKEAEAGWETSDVREQVKDALEAYQNGAYEVSRALAAGQIKALQEKYREYVVQ